MNWVGGSRSRSRCVKNKEDAIKQRAFFQKQRMKRKSNIMDSSKVQNSGNMDLLTLFIVNQIASKKEQTDKPKISSLIGPTRTKKAVNEPLTLPMSPCSPSKLNLDTSPPHNSVGTPGFKIKKHRLSEELKFTPLSPVLESNLSDLSGSESQHQPSSTSAGSSDPIQPKPTPHLPSSLPSRENPDNIKNTPKNVSFSQPSKLNKPWTVAFNEAPEQDLPHNSPLVGISFESTLPNPKIGEDSMTTVLYPPSSEEPEKPLFIDFKDTDCEVFPSMSSCDRSQNMDNAGHFSTQEFVCTNSNTCADGRNVCMHVCESPRRVYLGPDDTEAQRCDGNPPRTLNPVSFPTADQKTNVLTTGRQSFHFNQMFNSPTLSSPKDGHKRTGSRPSGPSSTNQQAQRHPKAQKGSFRKLRSQKSTKRDLTSILKPPFRKISEQKKEQMWEARVKVERCDSLCLESVMKNPVNDVSHAGESVKEVKKFTAEKGVNSEETEKIQEVANILLTLKHRKY
ncbi:uncharacterized protein [Pseudorasbora parva]|uniref:uncharacterized protein isoform X2 n=1 Tax=Pseudorasbora parva TaxID=51549 RepID=UPI00351E1EB2